MTSLVVSFILPHQSMVLITSDGDIHFIQTATHIANEKP